LAGIDFASFWQGGLAAHGLFGIPRIASGKIHARALIPPAMPGRFLAVVFAPWFLAPVSPIFLGFFRHPEKA
jgi:hypothetical protein